MKRITRNELNTEIALLISRRSTCGRLQVGCIITREGRMIVSGYNGPPSKNLQFANSEDWVRPHGRERIIAIKPNDGKCDCDLNKPCTQAIHAEVNAIAFAARQGIALENTVMYCTHSPCIKCAELITQAGIKEVIFIEHFRDAEGLQLLASNGIKISKYEAT